MKTYDDVFEILGAIGVSKDLYPNGCEFRLLDKGDGFLLQLVYPDNDVFTGDMEMQHARKWYVSPHSTETEVVATAFAALQRSVLHRAGEGFVYRGVQAFSPHIHIEQRLVVASPERLDGRRNRDKKRTQTNETRGAAVDTMIEPTALGLGRHQQNAGKGLSRRYIHVRSLARQAEELEARLYKAGLIQSTALLRRAKDSLARILEKIRQMKAR